MPPGADAGAAAAAHAHAAEDVHVSDVPSGNAVLRGRVVHTNVPAKAAGVEVLLYALPPSGVPGVRRVRTDDQGRFAFEGISDDPQTAWLVGARYAGVPFPGTRFSFAAGEKEHRVEIRIGEPTADASRVTESEVEMRVVPRGGELRVTELHHFENHGKQTVYVARDARAGVTPAFTTHLPAGAREFQVPLGIAPEGLAFEDGEVRFYGPIYPSSWPDPVARDQGITFSYTMSAADGHVALDRRFPQGARQLVVMAPEKGPVPHVPGAREEEAREVDGQRFRRWVIEPVKRGARVALAMDVPPARADRDAVHLEETRIFLELDDAALQVREEHHLSVSGDTAVVAPPDGPLLALPLPPGAEDLRFDRSAFALGLAPDDHGGAVLNGPLPPGETTIELAYNLPVPDPRHGVVLHKRFGAELPLLSIFVADTGVRLTSDRLHRRRPVATTDRTFLHLEAFQVSPDETVNLSMVPIRSGGGPPRAALYAVVALAAAAAVGFLGAPLRRGRAAAPLAEEPEDAARRDREAVYEALRDLEHDHETAKISDEDYASMRQDLRGRAAALMRAASAPPEPAATPVPSSPSRCGACGALPRPGDRFCAGCGARLVDGADPGASAPVPREGRGASA